MNLFSLSFAPPALARFGRESRGGEVRHDSALVLIWIVAIGVK